VPLQLFYKTEERIEDIIKSTNAKNNETNVTTTNTEKNAFLTCGLFGKITFDNSALEFFK